MRGELVISKYFYLLLNLDRPSKIANRNIDADAFVYVDLMSPEIYRKGFMKTRVL